MVKQLLKDLRKKPKNTRDNIALGVAGFFTGIVAIVWMYHLPSMYSSVESKDDDSFFGLFSDLKDQLATVEETKKVEPSPTSTVMIQDNRLNVGENNVPVQDWALPAESDTNNPATSTATSSQSDFILSSSSRTRTEGDGTRPIRIITTSNATSTTPSVSGQ